jgi:hypothetical protein
MASKNDDKSKTEGHIPIEGIVGTPPVADNVLVFILYDVVFKLIAILWAS